MVEVSSGKKIIRLRSYFIVFFIRLFCFGSIIQSPGPVWIDIRAGGQQGSPPSGVFEGSLVSVLLLLRTKGTYRIKYYAAKVISCVQKTL